MFLRWSITVTQIAEKHRIVVLIVQQMEHIVTGSSSLARVLVAYTPQVVMTQRCKPKSKIADQC